MKRRRRPILGVDYIVDPDGKAEYTLEFLEKRGYCCEHACRYCPYVPAAADHARPTDIAAGDANKSSPRSIRDPREDA